MATLITIALVAVTVCVLLSIVALDQRRQIKSLAHILDGTRTDLTNQLRATEHFRLVAEHASDGLLVQDMRGRILWASPSYCRIMRMKRDDVIGRNPLEFALGPDMRPSEQEIAEFRYDSNNKGAELQLFRNVRPDGSTFWNQINVSIRKSPSGKDFAVLVCRDVTEQIHDQERLKEVSRELEYNATHDQLTGLANRTQVQALIKDRIAKGGNEHAIGMLHIDLDGFKEINDAHGHGTGDAILRHAAKVISANIGDNDLAARIGGDEFIVICKDHRDLDGVAAQGQTILDALAAPVRIEDMTISVHASIGAALTLGDIDDYEALMARSDFALYNAKRQGRRRVAIYDDRLYAEHMSQQKRQKDLRHAIETGALEYHFQPVFDLGQNGVSGMETLVRWTDPQGNRVPPDEFLPIAKDLGLLAQLDLSSMTAALRMKERLNWAGFEDMAIGFNASSDLLLHKDFLPRLINASTKAGIPREQIVIEVLETTAIGEPDNPSEEVGVIADLHEAGFTVLLDDFGIGYAGLAHLSGLSAAGVKIDRSLVRTIGEDCDGERIVESIVDLCLSLGLTVIAEGVETDPVGLRLHEMGAHKLQGYRIARPMNADDMVQWLKGPRYSLPEGPIEQIRAAQ